MKSKYLLRRYYKYKRFYQHGYSFQREIVKVDSETKECSFTCRITNSVHLYSDKIQDMAKRIKEGDTFYVAEPYTYPNIPKYYK